MIPKPPFPNDVTLEDEIAEFERLKPRLNEVWESILMKEEEPHTSVVVPSLTLDQSELKKLPGVNYYEERLLFLLIRLRNPHARMVYVTSEPVHPMILEYYFQFLAGIPASHARQRLTLLCAHDGSPRSLTEKILERPRLIERIRAGIQDPSRAYLTVFNSTALERKLTVLLGIPLNGADPKLSHLGTKSGSRKVFREAEVELPLGTEDLRTEHEVENALVELKDARPGLKRAVVKLNDSFSGEGNALVRFPEGQRRADFQAALKELEFSVPSETPAIYFDKFARMGGIVEEYIEAQEKASPSAQMRVSPKGEVVIISTHDQILGGLSGQVFLGCSFPAQDEYRLLVQDTGVKIGQVLARYGVVSRFSVDFLVYRNHGEKEWKISALPGPPVPDRRAARSGHRPVLFPLRPRQVLPGDGQPEIGRLPGPAAGGPHRDPHLQQASLQSRVGVGSAVPPHRRPLRIREARPHGDRQQPRGGGRALSQNAQYLRYRNDLRPLKLDG